MLLSLDFDWITFDVLVQDVYGLVDEWQIGSVTGEIRKVWRGGSKMGDLGACCNKQFSAVNVAPVMIKAWICITCLFSSNLSEITDGSIRWWHHSGRKYNSTFVPLHRSLKRSFAFCFIMLWCASRNDREKKKLCSPKNKDTIDQLFRLESTDDDGISSSATAVLRRFYRNKRYHKKASQKWSFDVLKMRRKCKTLAALIEEVSDGRSEKTESRWKDVASANRNRLLFPVWSVCVCVKIRWKGNLLNKDKLQLVPSIKKIRRKGPNCANRADTYLEMWWLEQALWTLHTHEEDKSNP